MKYSIWIILLFSFVSLFIISRPVYSDTVVTTYVVETQKKRRSTRFTLTEWLRIKERMKLMDVWLAMFGPQAEEDKFKPELQVKTERRVGSFLFDSQERGIESTVVRSNLWLNNLVSSTTGVRLLNIDFGIEVGQEDFKLGSALESQSQSMLVGESDSFGFRSQSFLGLRVFGKSIQDSSLVLKYGMFQDSRQLHLLGDNSFQTTFMQAGGVMGADLDLYFNHWLGVEGHYLSYQAEDKDLLLTTQQSLGLFIEVSLIRFSIGRYQESSRLTHENVIVGSEQAGQTIGVSLFF